MLHYHEKNIFLSLSQTETIIFYIVVSATAFLMEMFFPGVTQRSGKITEIPEDGGRRCDRHPLEWKFQGMGGSKTKVLCMGVI